MVKTQSKKSLSPKFLALGVLLSLFLAGCQQSADKVAGRIVSDKGVNIENLLPGDLLFVAKVGTADQGQINLFKELTGYFPNDPVGALITEFNKGFKEGAKFDEVGLDYEKDILPILSERSMVVFAAAGNSNGSEKPKLYLAMTVADQAKMDSLLNKQLEKGLLSKDKYADFDYYSEKSNTDQPAYFARTQDVLFVTNSLDEMKKSLDSLKTGKSTLADNKLYQQMNAKNPASLGFLYADLPGTLNFLKNSGQETDEFKQAITAFAQTESYEKLAGELIVLSAEKNGLRLSTYLSAKDGNDLKDLIGSKTYLAKEIPAGDTLMYVESANFKKAFKQFFDTLAKDPANGNPEQEMKTALAAAGFDYEKDILAMLEKGFALVIEDSGSVIPSMGVYVDVSGNIEAAGRVAAIMDKSIDGMLLEAKAQSPETEMLLKKEVVEAGKLWKLKLNLDALLVGAPQEIGKKLTGQKIEFYYGILKDKMMVLALKPDLEKVYGQGKSVADGEEYKFAQRSLGNADVGMSYISPEQSFIYIDRLMKLAASAGAPIDTTEYEKVKSSMMPIKSLSGSSKMEGQMFLSQIFIHIGN